MVKKKKKKEKHKKKTNKQWNRIGKIERASSVPVTEFNGMTGVGCIKKVRFEQKPKEGESVSHVAIWRGVLQVVGGLVWIL